MPSDNCFSRRIARSSRVCAFRHRSITPAILSFFGLLPVAHAEETTEPANPTTPPAQLTTSETLQPTGDSSKDSAPSSVALPAPPALPPPAAPAAPPATVPSHSTIDVTVVGTKPAHHDYRTEKADLGPLGHRELFTLPLTVYGVSSELLSTQQIHETHDLMQFVPSVQMEARFGMEFGPPIIRGFEVDDNSENTRIDGLNVRSDTALPMDLYENYEVLTGPAGALYGPTYAGGMINGVLKRPTEKRFERVSLEFQGSSHGELFVDAGGRVGPKGMFGYRINAIHGDGEVYAPGSNLNRDLGSVAFDVRLPTRTTLEVLASDYHYNQLGYPGAFTFGGNTGSTHLPAPFDPTQKGLGSPWAGVLAHTRLLEFGARQAITRDWEVSAAVLHQIADREFHNTLTNTLTNNDGDYSTTYRQAGSQGNVLSNKLYVNGTLQTGFLRQELALGTNGFRADGYSRPQTTAGTLSLGTGNFSDPTIYGEPSWLGPGAAYKTSRTTVQNLVLNDTLHLGEQFEILLGGTLGWIHTTNYNASGATTNKINADAQISTMAGVAYQPRSDMTIYGNYADSIQPGEMASSCTGNAAKDLANCGQTLDPERSHQFEIGYRYRPIKSVDLSLAAFHITRPFAYTDATTNTFTVLGSQVNQGLEFLARGNPTRDVTIVSGLTLIDPKLKDTQSDSTRDKQVVGIPAVQGNVFVEYRLPWIQGLALTGSVHGRNHFPGNATNTTWARGFAIADAKARYTYPMQGALLSVMVGVDNIFNTRYWASVRGSVSGDPAGSNSAFLGSPRLLKCGLSLEL